MAGMELRIESALGAIGAQVTPAAAGRTGRDELAELDAPAGPGVGSGIDAGQVILLGSGSAGAGLELVVPDVGSVDQRDAVAQRGSHGIALPDRERDRKTAVEEIDPADLAALVGDLAAEPPGLAGELLSADVGRQNEQGDGECEDAMMHGAPLRGSSNARSLAMGFGYDTWKDITRRDRHDFSSLEL